MQTIHRHSDGSINMDFYRAQALRERNEYIRSSLPSGASLPSLTPVARQRVKLFAVAFALATGAFWATMLTSPPKTEAAPPRPGINVSELTVSNDLSMADPADAF